MVAGTCLCIAGVKAVVWWQSRDSVVMAREHIREHYGNGVMGSVF
jgi:hypothetical protein